MGRAGCGRLGGACPDDGFAATSRTGSAGGPCAPGACGARLPPPVDHRPRDRRPADRKRGPAPCRPPATARSTTSASSAAELGIPRPQSSAARRDTEVIAHLYEERGLDVRRRAAGHVRDRALGPDRAERLLLARDRLGVKPLYWAPVEGGLLYASEPGAILASGLGRSTPRPARDRRIPDPPVRASAASGFAGIRKLAPGERLVYERRRGAGRALLAARLLGQAPDRPRGRSARAARRAARRGHPRPARRRRAARRLPLRRDRLEPRRQLHGRGAQPGEDVLDRLPGRRASARASTPAGSRPIYGTEHEDRVLEPAIVPLVAEAVRFAGEPFADSSAIPTLLLSQDDAARTSRWRSRATAATRPSPAIGATCLARPPTGSARRPRARRWRASFAARVCDASVATGSHAAIVPWSRPAAERYATMMSHFDPAELSGSLHVRVPRRRGRHATPWAEILAPPDATGVDRYLALDTATYLPGDLLVKVDRMSMAHALEVRSPFLDYRVYRVRRELPAGLKLRRRTHEVAAQGAAPATRAPDHLVDRRKQGFGIPVGGLVPQEPARLGRGPAAGGGDAWSRMVCAVPSRATRG